jgi:hypothetical protein
MQSGDVRTCLLASLFGVLGGFVVVRVAMVQPAAAQSEQAAREFRVVDGSGAVRAKLNEYGLDLNDSRGVARIALRVAPDGTAFALLFDKTGGGSYNSDFRTPSVNFVDAGGRITASLPWTSAKASNFAPIGLMPAPGQPCVPQPGYRCPESVSAETSLQNQINSVRETVNRIAIQLNQLAQ